MSDFPDIREALVELDRKCDEESDAVYLAAFDALCEQAIGWLRSLLTAYDAACAEMNRALAEADMHRHDADSLSEQVTALEAENVALRYRWQALYAWTDSPMWEGWREFQPADVLTKMLVLEHDNSARAEGV